MTVTAGLRGEKGLELYGGVLRGLRQLTGIAPSEDWSVEATPL